MPGLSQLWPYVILGLAFGGVYAVTGTALVVLYRTTGVVNLAFGAIGALSCHIAWSFMGGSAKRASPKAQGAEILGYPLLIAVAAGLTLLYGVVIAPMLARRDPLVKSLGMVGMAMILLGFMRTQWDSSKARRLTLPSKSFKVGKTVVTTTQVAALLLALVVVLGVNLFLTKTATGTAMRAIANDRDVASLLGIPVRRVEAMAWLGSGVLCGIVFLLLPPLFQNLDQATMTWFIIGALGGAIVGQFKSLWITFIASVLIGVLESVLAPFSGNLIVLAKMRRMTPFIVAVIAILWISRKRTVVLAGREMR
jgi:branched-chain amino acid transport system permease protein